MFNQVSTLGVFRHYRKWKGFSTWKRHVRHKKTRLCRAALQKKLFLLTDTFQSALLHVRGMCYELEAMRLHDVQSGQLYTLEMFNAAQEAQKIKATEHLASFSAETADTVKVACETALALLEERLVGQRGGTSVEHEEEALNADRKGGNRMAAMMKTSRASRRQDLPMKTREPSSRTQSPRQGARSNGACSTSSALQTTWCPTRCTFSWWRVSATCLPSPSAT